MRYVLSIVAVIVFVIIAIILIATSGAKQPPKVPVNVTNYSSSGTSVSQITSGELVGENQYQSVEITVSDSSRTISILNGYEETPGTTQSFANTPAAYQAFLQAMQVDGFTDNRSTTEKYVDGVCPIGDTYHYILSDNNKTLTNFWSTSCNLGDGTFSGNGPEIRQLFSLQIPDYDSFTNNLTFVQTEADD